MVVECFILRFAKVTDIVHLRMLSGNEYVHVQIYVIFSGWRTRFSDLLIMIEKMNVMQKHIFLRISEVVCA